MNYVTVQVEKPGGWQQGVTLPYDATVSSVIMHLVTLYALPVTGPTGGTIQYSLFSRARSAYLRESHSLKEAGVTPQDTLLISTDLTAGGSLLNSPRMRRLQADYERMKELDARSDLIKVKSLGQIPPERYIVTYEVKSIVGKDRKGNPKMGNRHQVEIYLHSEYPQRWPGLKWLTSIWHPNISHVNGSVCIDAAWWGASRSLDRLVIMMGEMLQYKNFHDDPKKPPYPWDKEAAEWCRAYRRTHPDIFPTDPRELLRPERVKLSRTARTSRTEKGTGIKLRSAQQKKTGKIKLKS
jgi:ubiquitin-protein ligase